MNISFDGDIEQPEIQIAALPKEFLSLGKHLLEFQENELIIFSKGGAYKNYQLEIKQMVFNLKEKSDGLIQISLNRSNTLKLVIKSDKEGFIKLGDSLLNYFSGDVAKNDHFHIDYYEGNHLLSPTNISIIFLSL